MINYSYLTCFTSGGRNTDFYRQFSLRRRKKEFPPHLINYVRGNQLFSYHHLLITLFIPGNVGRMDAIVRCGRCLAGGRGCLLKGPHLIPSLKFRLPYLINVHQSINPFLLKSRGMKYCPSGKTPTY